jgi:hypothetical protein
VTENGDEFAEWDAAYVLGALSPQDRRRYEEHLASCPACRATVAELAGLPGLLAQLPAEDAARLFGEVAPDTELDLRPPPTLLGPVRRAQLARRRLALGLAAAAAAVVLFVGGLLAGGAVGLGPSRPVHVGFAQVSPSGLVAVADLVPVDRDRTEVRVECQYATQGDPREDGENASYDIVVVDRSGVRTVVYSWAAKPDRLMRPHGIAAVPLSRITDVEIRTTVGQDVLLRAQVR